MGEKEIRMTRRSFVRGIAGAGAVMAIGGIDTEKTLALSIDKEASDGGLTDTDGNEKYRVTDDIGRTVELPSTINKIVPSGKYAEAVLMTLCPDKLASITEPIEDGEEKQFDEAGLSEISELAETGEMYPADAREDSQNFDIRKVDDVKSDLILDIGTKKGDLKSTLEYTQVKSDTPVIFLDGTFGKLPQVYRKLGAITGCRKRAEELAAFIENIQEIVQQKKTVVREKINVYYAKNDDGRQAYTGYSFPNEAIRTVGAEPVTVNEVAVNDQISIENLKNKDIDFIIFNDPECLKKIVEENNSKNGIWKQIGAINNGSYALAPGLFHNWVGFPMFVQIIGMLWIGSVLWHDEYSGILIKHVKEFYRLFYGYEFDADELNKLLYGAVETDEY